MNTFSIKQIELYNLIHHFNIHEIDKLVSFAKKNKIMNENTSRKSLAGIWSDFNFEKVDLEKEVRELRSNLYKF